MENLCKLWACRQGLSYNQKRWLTEYLVDVLSEEAEPSAWEAALLEARRRALVFFPEESLPGDEA